MRFGTFKFGVFKFGEVGRGYKVFLRAGTPPDVAIDSPVALVEDTAASAALDVPSIGLAANSTYFGAVVPFNEFGDAVAPAEFSLKTDGGGAVQLIPDVVTGLRAVVLPGGFLRVSWNYDPVYAELLIADDFVIDLQIETAAEYEVIPLIDPIPHRQPQRSYSREVGPISEGLVTVRVYSRRGGLYEANVGSVQARIDATAPAAVSMGAEVV